MTADGWQAIRRAAAAGSLGVVALALVTTHALSQRSMAIVLAVCGVTCAVMWGVHQLPDEARSKLRTPAVVAGFLLVGAIGHTWAWALIAVVAGVLLAPSWLLDRWPDVAIAVGLVALTLAGSSLALPLWSTVGWLALALAATVAAVSARAAAARPIEGGIASARPSRLARTSWWWAPLALAALAAPVVAALAKALTDRRQESSRPRYGNRSPLSQPTAGDGTGGLLDDLRSGLGRLGSGLARLFGAEEGNGNSGPGRPPPPPHGGSWWPALLLVALVVAAAAVLGWWLWRRRRAGPGPGWDERAVRDLERLGRRMGRARQPSETVDRYAASLAQITGSSELAAVGPTLSRSLFGPAPLPDDARLRVLSTVRSVGRAQRRPVWRRRARQTAADLPAAEPAGPSAGGPSTPS